MFRTSLFRLVLFVCAAGFGESLLAQTERLDLLIAEASPLWDRLQQNEAQRQAALASVDEASRAYRPNLDFGVTYTLAAGGRTIGFPIGDLLNPAYQTLNQLTSSQSFPQLENQEVNFLPNNFYDARFRVRQPIYDARIPLNRARAALGVEAAEAAGSVTAYQLKADLRSSYFQLWQAATAINILADADTLLAEAQRTTNSLIRNGAALPVARERLVAERAQLEAQRASARATLATASAQIDYFSRPGMAAEILADSLALAQLLATDLQALLPDSGAAAARPELRQLDLALQNQGILSDIEAKFYRPSLGAQVDLGSQAFNFDWTPYVLGGLSLEWNLYDGGRHKSRRARLAAEQTAIEAQRRDALRGFGLQAEVARQQLLAAQASFAAYQPAIAAAERTLRDAELLYRNGTTGYLELVDARSQLTRVRIEHNLARYNAWLRYAAWLSALGR